MKRLLFIITAALAVAALVPALAPAQQDGPARSQPGRRTRQTKVIDAVRAVLDAQVSAWNRGDIEGFMDGYARSPETVFVSGDTVTRGWQTVLDRYKKGYQSRAQMGTLAFTELEIKPLGKETALALGRWQLTRAGDAPHGRFTLILHRMPEGWRIVHDHTSAAS
ncbi:MAG TPA: nuclear transport factor 2 family protein [Pyrinomonadaceae bacterium]